MNNMECESLSREAIIRMNNGQFGKAVAVLDQLIAADSDDWRPLIGRSYCKQQLSQMMDALSDANTATTLNPNLSSHSRKGMVLLALKQYRSAENCLIAALDCEPNHKLCKSMLTDIRRQFCHAIGLDSNELAIKYNSCSLLTDAIIDGTIVLEVSAHSIINNNTNGSDNSVNTSDADLVINELTVYCHKYLTEEPNLSNDAIGLNDANANHTNKACTLNKGIRAPKTNPFAKKNSSAHIDGTIQLKNASFVSLASSSDLSCSDTNIEAKLNSSNTTPTKKIVSTRPKFMRKVNLND